MWGRAAEEPIAGLWAAIVVIIFGLVARSFFAGGRRKRLPPGPRPWPVIGNLASLGALPHEALAKLADTYGPLMYLRLGSVHTYVVSSAKMAREVLHTHDRELASRPLITSCEILGYGSQNFGILPYGDQWRSTRKLFVTELINAKRIVDTQQLRKDEILLMLRSALQASDGGSKPARMFDHYFQMTANVVTRLMISKRVFGPVAKADFDGKEFQDTVVDVVKFFGVFNIGDFIPALKRFDLQGYEKQMWKTHAKMDKFLQGILDSRAEEVRRGERHAEQPEDFIDVMLSRPLETTGKPMTQDQIKGMLVDVLVAGTDTTAMSLEWALAELLRAPDLLEQCHRELDAVVGSARAVSEDDLPHLPLLRAVVKETLRLHPPGALMLPHQAIAPCDIAGFHIPAGSRVLVNVWAIARDPASWDRPRDFHPHRFLPNQEGCTPNMAADADSKMFPFGSGRRGCPGKILALPMIEYGLAVLLHSCHWTLPPGVRPEELDMSEKFALGVCKAVELEAIPTPRLPNSLIFGSLDG